MLDPNAAAPGLDQEEEDLFGPLALPPPPPGPPIGPLGNNAPLAISNPPAVAPGSPGPRPGGTLYGGPTPGGEMGDELARRIVEGLSARRR